MAKIRLPRNYSYDSMRAWLLLYKQYNAITISRCIGVPIEKVLQWYIIYDVVDPKNEKLFKVWVGYKDYTVAELAILSRKTARSIKYYLKKYKITKYDIKPGQFSDYRTKPKDYTKISTAMLRDPEKLQQLHNVIGRRMIARLCGVSVERIKTILKRHGIKCTRTKYDSKNKFKNKEWLYDRYVTKAMPMEMCAMEAKVAPHTIRNWLIAFGIRPRDKYEAPYVRYAPQDNEVLTVTTRGQEG